MRIAHGLLSHEFAGAERHLAELANWQSGHGHNVHLLLETLKPEIEKRWRAAVPKAHFHFLPTWWPSTLSGLWALAVLSKVKPDIYHAHLGRAARRLGWAARMLHIPFVGTLHLNYRRKEHAKTSGVIRIANWQKADMKNYTGNATTIWNWVAAPVHKTKPETARKKIRTDIGADAKTIVFFSAGRNVPQKGLDVLVKAFERAYPQGNENVRLLLAGNGTDAFKPTDKRITPMGYLNDVSPLYAAADIFVSAARYEPFGLVITEAMSHGLPLVCTRTQGPSEFLNGYKNVTWAAPANELSLATALRNAAQAYRGRVKYNLKPFSIAKAAPAVMAFYKKIIAK